jgi:hypothetical protein
VMTQFSYGSYNLENGGIDNGDDRRLRRQLTLLAQAGADAWALQECKHWADGDAAVLHLAEEQLGMTGYLAARAGLRVTGPRHELGHPYWHAVARVITQAAGLPGPLHLASAHLAPSGPAAQAMTAATDISGLADLRCIAFDYGGYAVTSRRAAAADANGGRWFSSPASPPRRKHRPRRQPALPASETRR